MVGATGFEPATSCSQSKCSSQAELRSDPRRPVIFQKLALQCNDYFEFYLDLNTAASGEQLVRDTSRQRADRSRACPKTPDLRLRDSPLFCGALLVF